MTRNEQILLFIGLVVVLSYSASPVARGIETMVGGFSTIVTVARNAGFQGPDLIKAVAIALAESGGDPNAHGDVNLGTGTGSFGLWQIYSDAHPEFGPDFTQLYDPQANANAAYQIYSKAGYSFRPWTTFKNGAYLAYRQQVSDAVSGSA